jgi:hypothetical protein
VEHIIPESLGGERTQPRGVVCDQCNNYFARKVEQPFLASTSLLKLRGEQLIPNKEGRLVGLPGVLDSGHRAIFHFGPEGQSIEVPDGDGVRALLAAREGGFTAILTPPDPHVQSRFLAKMALEVFALRLIEAGFGTECMFRDDQLDPIREHARRGDRRVRWPFSRRHLYDANTLWREPDVTVSQRMNEWDLLLTDYPELYFVIVIFGVEFAINVGGPDIRGYEVWLRQHGGASPLFWPPSRDKAVPIAPPPR